MPSRAIRRRTRRPSFCVPVRPCTPARPPCAGTRRSASWLPIPPCAVRTDRSDRAARATTWAPVSPRSSSLSGAAPSHPFPTASRYRRSSTTASRRWPRRAEPEHVHVLVLVLEPCTGTCTSTGTGAGAAHAAIGANDARHPSRCSSRGRSPRCLTQLVLTLEFSSRPNSLSVHVLVHVHVLEPWTC